MSEITREQKQNVFKPMLENFETDQMKEYFLDMVAEIPDYIFTMPSSTSGKYHNKTQCETYGQLWHVYMFSSVLNHRLRLKGNQEKFKSPNNKSMSSASKAQFLKSRLPHIGSMFSYLIEVKLRQFLR